MKKASLVIKEIQEGTYNDVLKEVYIDESRIEKQPQRYVASIEKFISLYGDQEIEIYSTPGRSEVSGNHTDHQNGEVLAAAINLDIIAVVSKNDVVKVLSDDYDLKPISLDDLSKKEDEVGTSEGLMRGVLARFKELGYAIGGFNAYMTSDVLQGSGLSSSAAFEVMIGTILSGLYNEMKVDPVVIGQVGQYSENVYFGKPCGLMDQSACSVGSLIHIDFKDNSKPVVEKVDVEFSSFKHSLCIVDVHASHADLTDDYAAVPYEMKKVAQFFGKEFLREVDEKDFYNQLVEVRHDKNLHQNTFQFLLYNDQRIHLPQRLGSFPQIHLHEHDIHHDFLKYLLIKQGPKKQLDYLDIYLNKRFVSIYMKNLLNL